MEEGRKRKKRKVKGREKLRWGCMGNGEGEVKLDARKREGKESDGR